MRGDGRFSQRWSHLKSLNDLPDTEKTHFLNLCHLAFRGLEDSETTFNTMQHHFLENIDGLGLLYIAPKLSDCGTIQIFNFMHLNFQEFCAAFHITTLPECDQQEHFMKHQDNPKFQICWQFFSGLTKLKCQQIFISMIPLSNIHSSFCKLSLIQLLSCLYEAKSPDLCKQAIVYMNGSIDLSRCYMDSLVCSSLSSFIKMCTGFIKTLKLSWCGITDEGFQCICEALIKSKSDVKNHLFSLDVSYNNLTEHGAQHIAKLLSSSCVIESLNCSGNYNLGDKGIEIITNSLLNNIQVNCLEFRRIGSTLRGFQAISNILSVNTNINKLDISENILDTDMLSCLLGSLANNCTLNTLLLKWCGLGVDAAKLLGDMIKSNNALTDLDLGYNKLGAGGIANVVEALAENKTLQMLNLNGNGITCNDAHYIAQLISANLCHISSLHIGGNFEEQGLATVCKAIEHNVSLATLDLAPYSMSVAKNPLDFLGNVFTNKSIKSLQIVTPYNCSSLSQAIVSNTTLEELKICSQVINGFEILTQSIAENETITKVEFSLTKLDEHWLRHISSMLQVKTNLVSLVINGEVYAKDCMLLCDALLSSLSLKNLSFNPYEKMTSLQALQFLSNIQRLNSLETITLSFNPKKILEDEANMAQKNVQVFNEITRLIWTINERRCSIGYPELWLYFEEI